MDGFSYTNIFDTKGIEYLIIIAFLILIIPFWILINRPLKPARAMMEKAVDILSLATLRIPRGLFFSRHHTWAFLENNGRALTGVDDLLPGLTGEVSVTLLFEAGQGIRKGEAYARIGNGNKFLNLVSPISGKVAGVNRSLTSHPDLLGKDAYGAGWLYSIEPDNWRAETGTCYFAEEAVKWMREELTGIREFILDKAGSLNPQLSPVVLQEGGELSGHPLKEMSKDTWEEFQVRFL